MYKAQSQRLAESANVTACSFLCKCRRDDQSAPLRTTSVPSATLRAAAEEAEAADVQAQGSGSQVGQTRSLLCRSETSWIMRCDVVHSVPSASARKLSVVTGCSNGSGTMLRIVNTFLKLVFMWSAAPQTAAVSPPHGLCGPLPAQRGTQLLGLCQQRSAGCPLQPSTLVCGRKQQHLRCSATCRSRQILAQFLLKY